MEHPNTAPQASHVGHEERDVRFAPVVAATFGLAVLAVLAFLTMLWLFDFYAERSAELSPPANPLAKQFARKEPPEPRLQPAPLEDLMRLRATEDEVLHSYGWVDKEAGTVRVPIERALELLAKNPPPSRPAPGGAAR